MKIKILFFCIFFSFLAISQDARTYIKEYSTLAIHEMNLYSIPASITLAQGILESGSGTSTLAVEANNHFGIKCHVDWFGPAVYHDDDEKMNVLENIRMCQNHLGIILFSYHKEDDTLFYLSLEKMIIKAGLKDFKKQVMQLVKLMRKN